MNKTYICIDLKSFYASVECQDRNLDPLKTNLVVADISRTEKTICLAISPSLKKLGLPGRARLFEVSQKIKKINNTRKINGKFTGKSCDDNILTKNPHHELDYIIAKPRMAVYMKYSTKIYNIYLKYISKEDIYVYSIDEVFCDITNYLNYYNLTPEEFITMVIKDVFNTTGITATAGIGTNLFLAKVAMDVLAKHKEANEFGVRIAKLDEISYRNEIWGHKPITDIWRIGSATANKLAKYGIYTMGDIARYAIKNENFFYNLFGVNAELLIDHAFGYEPCTIKDIKEYEPINNSISNGQVLHEPYDYLKAKLVVEEMVDLLALELVEKNLVTDQIILTIGYDIENIKNENIRKLYHGELALDRYNRLIPKHAHGTVNIDFQTSSSLVLIDKVLSLYDKIINPNLLVKRIYIYANHLIHETALNKTRYEQLNMFEKQKKVISKNDENKDKQIQKTIINIKKKYGKNAILKGMNLLDGSTTIDRNKQIGGHHE